MSSYYEDTICAVSTPPGASGLAVVRMSGNESLGILESVFKKKSGFEPRRMYYGVLGRERDIDECMAVYFKAPASYTGEDMAEFYLHGGKMPAKLCVELLIGQGARLAQPGEFSRRAFLNGKMDLTQAEAVMDLINASTQAQARNAVYSMRGALMARIDGCVDSATDILAAIEAYIEYPEEDFEGEDISGMIGSLEKKVKALADSYKQGEILKEGYRVAIVGRPNVGKSSLLNALLMRERAIVDDVAGTTRDVIDAEADINGLAVRFFDTAGIRETSDKVEAMGVTRSYDALNGANLALLVVDAREGLTAGDRELLREIETDVICVANKTDLGGAIELETEAGVECVSVCAADGANVGALKDMIFEHALDGKAEFDEGLITSRRHSDALNRAAASLAAAGQALKNGLPHDMAAIDIREARHALGEITGKSIDEEIVDRIFTKFCLGK